jgi:hypothetical protein
MAIFKSDSQGFLIGEVIKSGREAAQHQQQSIRVWSAIRSDVRAIARAMGLQAATTRRAANSPASARPVATPSRSGVRGARTAGGNHVGGAAGAAVNTTRSPAVAIPGRSAAARATLSARATAEPVTPQRAANGRFVANAKRNNAPTEKSDPGSAPAIGGNMKRMADSIGQMSTALQSTEGLDPTLNAAKEIKDVVSPLGRGLFTMFGRNAERKKERWYSRFLKALTPKKAETPQAGGGGGGGLLGGMLGGGRALAVVPLMLVGLLGRMFAPIAAAWAAFELGQWLGGRIYKWLDESGLMGKIFDAFDSIKGFFKSKWGEVQAGVKSFNAAREEARAGPAAKVDASGRAISDPRRLDQQEAKPKTLAQAAGAIVGNFQRGQDYMAGKGGRNAAEDRALATGASYSAGNIRGLDDAQTRALVASTALTESGGGKLGVINSAGYMGRYQAGAGWLADAGLINGGSAAVKAAMKADGFTNEYKWGQSGGMTRFLKDDKNWAGDMNYQKYLGSAAAQDAAFKKNSDAAYGQMLKNGTINAGTSQEQIAGLLKARHIAGMGGAIAVSKGGTGAADANGTSARKYFDDVAGDRNGFLKSFRVGEVAPAAPVIPRPAQPSIPPSVPATIPPVPDVPAPPQKLNSDSGSGRSVSVVIPKEIGQNIGDRSLAHIATGGLGG